MLELVAGVAVAIVVLALVLEPLARPMVATLGRPAADFEDDPFEPLDESASPKIRALLALKEIEFDLETGKLSEEDFARLRARYAADAIDAIRAEEVAVPDPAVAVHLEESDDPVEAMIQAARVQARACPHCGPRPEADAAFCSDCGRALSEA